MVDVWGYISINTMLVISHGFSGFILGLPILAHSPGRELDKKKVPKAHLARNETKGGTANVVCRRDQLRFLKHCDKEKFADGLKEQLTDKQIGMAFYLGCGLPPWHKLRDMRCRNLGVLMFGCNETCVFVGSWLCICILGPWLVLLFLSSLGKRRS